MIFIVSAITIMLAIIGAASAHGEVNGTQENLSEMPVDEDILDETDQSQIGENQTEPIKTSLESDDDTVVKGNEVSVKLTDENGTGIANKTITVELNKKSTKIQTGDDGVAKYKVNVNQGTYTIKYSFSASANAVASSSIITGASLSIALAIAILCTSPPERYTPLLPYMVSIPSGSFSRMSPHCASRSAFNISSLVAFFL